jgi:hypothetical protein
MLQTKGNIWDFYEKGEWIAITTSGTVTPFGRAVMGKGVALQARYRFPSLPHQLAEKIVEGGNKPYAFPDIKIVTFPTKRNWWEKSNLTLIVESCSLLEQLRLHIGFERLYTVRPGCGAGKLQWEYVEPVISKLLNDNFIVVSP